ncbi:hypothetical protein [Rhodopirellula bahusiensis]|uniref:Uncharacterized protein n=2 Tax=Rhodopirellula TaxID=265488 RepID=A0A2G1W7Z1_9BACT|nr:hypothetical protein [Rhodopirellula bahusiensis]PHQ35143.1 hypothetical protein CEE69_12045 [Rhodopirellula bahusiensis]|tara:strand:- start:14466 stop:14816 length:351 start_codon:yes stop_codon:yes gene_type:complete
MMTRETNQIAELAALIDAIPRGFREPILLAAIVTVPHRIGNEDFVVSLRSRFVDCLNSYAGVSISPEFRCSVEYIEIREVVAMFATSNSLDWTESLVRQLVHAVATRALPAEKVKR